jgi:hypothetical protein
MKTAPARAAAVLVTFLAVTLAWVPFRADTLADAGTMLALLWPAPHDPLGLPSIAHFLDVQFFDLRGVIRSVTLWFKPRELWPPVLPPDFLATMLPLGLLLAGITLATFTVPNTCQVFERFEPALGLPEEATPIGALARLDRRVATVVAAMFVFCVLRLTHVSPFLYYQF